MKPCSKSTLKTWLLKRVPFFMTMLALLLSLPTRAFSGPVIDRVVAIVGEEVITQSDLDRLKRSKQGPSAKDHPQSHWELTRQLIEERLILQEVKRKNISVSEAELEFALNDIETRNRFPSREAFRQAVALESPSWEAYVASLKSQLLVLKLLNREIDMNISIEPEATLDYYETHPEAFTLPDRVRLKQILLQLPSGAGEAQIETLKQEADALYEDAIKGRPFDQLVHLYSEGPEKAEAGDLGFFNQGDLAPEIDRAVFGRKKGDIVSPIQSPLGFHLFKIEDVERGRREPLDKVQKEIEEKLLSKLRSARQSKWIEGLFERAYIDIKPEFLSAIDP